MSGAAVAYKCRTQDITSLSSTESELIAVDEATRALRYLLKLLRDFGVPVEEPVLVGQDNMSTIALINSTHFNPRTRHLALRYHHCGEQQREGVLKIGHLPTEHMAADVLTKALGRAAFDRHRAVLMGHQRIVWLLLDED